MSLGPDSSILTEANVAIDFSFRETWKAGLAADGEDPVAMLCKTITTGSRFVKAMVNGIPGNWREWLGERVFHDLSRHAFQFENKTYELSGSVNVDDLEDDQYGGFGDIGSGIAASGLALPRRLLAAALLAGTSMNAFDGQYFFDTDHPRDPADGSSTVYSNYTSTGLGLTGPNFGAVLSLIRRFKNPNGDPLGIRGVRLIVPPQLEDTARLIVAPTPVGGSFNVNAGRAQVVVLDELEVEPTAWYVGGESGGMKPFINSVRMPPNIVTQSAPDSEGRFLHNQIRVGGKARGAVVPVLPFLMYKAVA